jgi:hypothetical protein
VHQGVIASVPQLPQLMFSDQARQAAGAIATNEVGTLKLCPACLRHEHSDAGEVVDRLSHLPGQMLHTGRTQGRPTQRQGGAGRR